MRELNKHSALKVKSAGPGKYSDGGGLWLHKRQDGSAQWFLRVSIHARRREMGLGGLWDVSLKETRTEAEKWRAVVRQDKDPIKEREKLKRKAPELITAYPISRPKPLKPTRLNSRATERQGVGFLH